MKKMRAGLKLCILAFAMLMMPIFAQKVSAEEQVKIELTYIYVNETGGNSLYIDTQYVPAGTTWGTFFETYQKCYEDGTIADADENNAWKVRVQQVNYSRTNGTDVGDLNPEGHATRAEAATMITQFMNRSSNS